RWGRCCVFCARGDVRGGLAALALVAAAGCGTAAHGPSAPSSPGAGHVGGHVEIGTATFYSSSLAGHPTASGEPYRPGALTAAHRTLPLGTLVRVTRVDRDERPIAGPVVVRINDRGPFAHGRIIDLSAAAARQLRMIDEGVARVKLEVVELPAGRGRH